MNKFFRIAATLIFYSCQFDNNNLGNIVSTDEDINLLQGDWQGYMYYWQSDTLSGEGELDWDYIIDSDSVLIFDFPTEFVRSSSYNLMDDTIYFANKKIENAYKWTVKDSFLILTSSYKYQSQTGYDSMVFIKANFPESLVLELKSTKFKLDILENNSWIFDISNTQNYGWKAYDTAIYNPPKEIKLSKNSYVINNKDELIYNLDTFKISSLNDRFNSNSYSLNLKKVINLDTIILYYYSL